ncbi:MAG: hypothetical protein ACRDHN_19455, partial [Thermomicrobiales bacterium]
MALFWAWFAEVADRFYETIEKKECSSLATETSAKVDELLPGFAWVFGPGPDKKGHSFTLSGEGIEAQQLLALHWLAMAPTLAGWTFYAARQSGSIKGNTIAMGDLKFDPKEIWVTPSLDTDAEKINLTVWHPSWEQIDVGQRWTITFLFLDEALGEYGTQWWVGEIQFGQSRLGDSFPLEELAAFVAQTTAKNGWKKYPPGESWTLFQLKESGEFSRGDLIVLNTCAPRLFQNYMKADGDLQDPLPGSGA